MNARPAYPSTQNISSRWVPTRNTGICTAHMGALQSVPKVSLILVFLVNVLGVELALGQEDSDTLTPSDYNITAVRIEEDRIKVDRELDEVEWDLAEPVTDFVQNEPLPGRPATEQTEVRLLYDSKNLYIGVYCFDSESPAGLVAQELTRDFSPRDNDVSLLMFVTILHCITSTSAVMGCELCVLTGWN